MALDMMEVLESYNEVSRHNLQMRIGLDTGTVVAGVIGIRKFVYDLWGDVVNTASRMESDGVAGRIQLTESTRRRLSVPFMFEPRDPIYVKGKGEMRTWFMTGRSNCAEARQYLTC